MYILDADQIRRWDQFTMLHEPVSSIDLMERAAKACFDWLSRQQFCAYPISIYCGAGNNGGDGLALARLLAAAGTSLNVYLITDNNAGSADFQLNLSRLKAMNIEPVHLQQITDLQLPGADSLIVDAIFGTGLNRPPTGLAEQAIQLINKAQRPVISIDIPSGLYCQRSAVGNTVVQASYTLSFQCLKPAFLFPENAAAIGKVEVLDIGLHPANPELKELLWQLLEAETLKSGFIPRKENAHKGNFGYAGLIAGSKGMMGAAVLAAKACLRSGVGKLACICPDAGTSILQTTVPEAICLPQGTDYISTVPSAPDRFSSLAIGPGIGQHPQLITAIQQLLQQYQHPLVIDADAITLLAGMPEYWKRIPPNTILTPHPKEFERMFGKTANDFERWQLALDQANALQIIIVLKGHHTLIACPDGKTYFNTSGNAGMAKAGSGDALTGVLLALLAQGYPAELAARLGVFIHGRAGDLALQEQSYESLLPEDLIAQLGKAFRSLY